MTNRRQNKLRKNPFVRLFRMIYRSLRIIFRPKSKRLALAALYEQRALEARQTQEALNTQRELEAHRVQEALNTQHELEARQVQEALTLEQELDDRVKEQFLTVGELLKRVKWQTTTAQASSVQDFSLN
jgi:hypothetical protein